MHKHDLSFRGDIAFVAAATFKLAQLSTLTTYLFIFKLF